MLAGLEPGIEAVELGLAKQTTVDGGSGGQGCIEVDEGLFRRARSGQAAAWASPEATKAALTCSRSRWRRRMDPSPSGSI